MSIVSIVGRCIQFVHSYTVWFKPKNFHPTKSPLTIHFLICVVDCGFIAHSKCSELVPAKCLPDLKRIRGVFGVDLTTMSAAHKCSIPFVIKHCVEEVEARGMLQEGIYRVSGFADEIDALKLALDRDGEKTDMSESAFGNINVVAGTLKMYLRLLPVPLVTFQAYPAFINSASKFGRCHGTL